MRSDTATRHDGCSPAHGREARPASPPAAVRVDVQHGLPRPLVRVSGELDIATVPLLVAMLDHARGKHAPADGRPRQRSSVDVPVDVDLGEVTFADSHGLAPILDSRTTVVRASPVARRALGLCHDVEMLRRADRASRTSAPPRQRWTGAEQLQTWGKRSA